MGKYSKPKEPGDYDDSFLRMIANELAEANRLKIVGLKAKCQELDFEVHDKNSISLDLSIVAEELEDQA